MAKFRIYAEDEELLTTEETASYLKVNIRTIYRLLRAHKIPALRVGGQWRFRKGDVDEWLNVGNRFMK